MKTAKVNKKYCLEQILNDDPNYLQEQALNRVKVDCWKNGDFKHVSLRAIVLLLEKQVQSLRQLDEKIDQLLSVQKEKSGQRREF